MDPRAIIPMAKGMKTKTKRSSRTKNYNPRPLKRIEVSLDRATIAMALKLGDGDLSLGIRRAVVLASKGQH